MVSGYTNQHANHLPYLAYFARVELIAMFPQRHVAETAVSKLCAQVLVADA